MRKTGILLIGVSIILFLIDRFSHALSDILGKIVCGDQFLNPVNGVTGDVSCGFNADMYLVAFLLVILFVGVLLFLPSANEKADNNY